MPANEGAESTGAGAGIKADVLALRVLSTNFTLRCSAYQNADEADDGWCASLRRSCLRKPHSNWPCLPVSSSFRLPLARSDFSYICTKSV